MLVPNWRAVLARAWSVRILGVAAVLSGVEVMLPILGGKLPISDITRALIYFTITAAAFVARLVAQKKMKVEP